MRKELVVENLDFNVQLGEGGRPCRLRIDGVVTDANGYMDVVHTLMKDPATPLTREGIEHRVAEYLGDGSTVVLVTPTEGEVSSFTDELKVVNGMLKALGL